MSSPLGDHSAEDTPGRWRRQIGMAGLTFGEASRAVTQLARVAQEAWEHPDVQALVRERQSAMQGEMA